MIDFCVLFSNNIFIKKGHTKSVNIFGEGFLIKKYIKKSTPLFECYMKSNIDFVPEILIK